MRLGPETYEVILSLAVFSPARLDLSFFTAYLHPGLSKATIFTFENLKLSRQKNPPI